MQLETKKKWSAIIAKQKSSRLTVAAFCRQAHIAPSTFYQRKREIENTDIATTFVKATVTEKVEVMQHHQPLTLHVGDVRLSLPSSTSAGYLAGLIRGIHS